MGFPCGSAGKESACNGEDLGSTPALRRAPVIMIPIVRIMTLTEQVLYVIIKTFYRYSLIHYENKPSNREQKIQVHEDFIMCPCLHNKFANGTVNIQTWYSAFRIRVLRVLKLYTILKERSGVYF